MARAPDPRIDEVKATYLKGVKLVEIPHTGWICRRERSAGGNPRISGKANVRIEKVNARKEREGHSRAIKTAPEVHQETRKQLPQESLKLSFLIAWNRKSGAAGAVPPDKEQLLLQEIRLLTVREHRMLKRIDLLRTSMDDSGEVSGDETGMTAVGHKKGIEKDKETDHGVPGQAGPDPEHRGCADPCTGPEAGHHLHRYGVDDARGD